MEERIAYILPPTTDAFELNQHLDFSTPGEVSVRDVTSSREWQSKLSVDELSKLAALHPGLSRLSTVLKDPVVTSFSIRWASSDGSSREGLDHPASPFGSYLPAGLHVFIGLDEGVRESLEQSHFDQWSRDVCDTIRGVFGEEIKCSNFKDTFTQSSPQGNVYQLYAVSPTLNPLVSFLTETFCQPGSSTCSSEISSLLSACQFDFDYSQVRGLVTSSALWDKSKGPWTETLSASQHTLPDGTSPRKVEIGVLLFEPALEVDELSATGILAVVGRDSEPKAVKFQFPSRHRTIPLDQFGLSFSASFDEPAGLHPTLQISFNSRSALTPPRTDCFLNAYLTLPSYFFVDQYQLGPEQKPLLDFHKLGRVLSLTGETDLEAPEWAIPKWGSAALFELALPNQVNRNSKEGQPKGDDDDGWEVTIPLHLRYLSPSNSSSSATPAHRPNSNSWFSLLSSRQTVKAPLPWPAVFWSCPSSPAEDDTPVPFSTNPFDRTALGYDLVHDYARVWSEKGYADTNTIFFHIPPAVEGGAGEGSEGVPGGLESAIGDVSGHTLYASVDVPVLDSSWAGTVQYVTAAAVILGFLFVLRELVRTAYGGTAVDKGKLKKKKKKVQ